MHFSRIGLSTFVTLLASVLLPLTVCCGVFLEQQQSIQAQDSRTRAEQLSFQGLGQYQKGQRQAAIESWQEALLLYQQLKDRRGEGTTLKNLGATYMALENYSKAIEYLQSFLVIVQATDDGASEAQALGNLGIAYKELGKYDEAIAFQQKALLLMGKIKDRQGEGQVLGNLGNAYEAVGDYDKAIESYQQSLSISQETKDQFGEATTLGNLGAIYANLGKYDQAIESYKKSLAIAQAISDQVGEASTLNNLGIAHHVKNQLGQALEYYTQSLLLARKNGNRQLQAEILANLGLVYEDQRNFNKAIEYQQQTLNIAQAISDRRLEARALNNLGHTLFITNNFPEAEKQLQAALKVLESLRPGLSDADKISIFDTQIFSYNLQQKILVAQHKYEAALEVAEQGRARAFVELLAQRLSPEIAEKSKINSQPPTIDQIKQIAQTHKATLVEYSLVPGNDFKFQGKLRAPAANLLIWVVQPTGKITFRQVDLKFLQSEGTPETSIENLVRISRNLNGPGAARSQAVRKQLHQLLIEPIVEFLPKDTSERVIFIPQESLFLLPFPALEDASGQYLIKKHTILTAPAIQVLNLTHQQRQRLSAKYPAPLQSKDILIVGNPTMPADLEPLPAAEQEALAIAEIFNTKAIVRDLATKVDIVQKFPQSRLVHMATHGLLDNVKKGIPGALAFAPSRNDDGFLTSGEILNLKLNAELVVLSACNTGRGKITGDGVIGLSRSLITSGVPSVIVSLWSVPDAPTSRLMTEFYRNFQKNPDKATALRQAMLMTMKQSPNPYNWAAFTLIGEAD